MSFNNADDKTDVILQKKKKFQKQVLIGPET